MDFTVIDRDAWSRREYFEHYLSAVPCTYSMTTKLDITNLRRKGRKLCPTMLYLLAKTVNRHEEFRMAFRQDGQLVRYSSMNPSYTVFHPESKTFSNLWTEYTESYEAFCRSYQEDIQRFGSVEGFYAKPDPPENCFPVSMIPWRSFEGFNLNTPDFRYLIPIFTMGRYEEKDGRWYLPLAVQVHHAVCDGYHLCQFLEDLERQIGEL